ncbi:partial Multifunctional conjugation protein TraI, partial [uncultured bacterium]
MVAAKFEHSTSREGDPQLHTHVLVMNMTQTPDGWRAVENKAMFENRQMLDSFYKNELANGLQRAGIDAFTILNEKGVVDIRVNGLEGSEDVFSKRHDQIQGKAAELRENGKNEGVHDAEIRERANFETRASKGNLSREELQTRWNGELAEIGKDKNSLLEAMKTAAGAGGEKQFSAEDYVKTSTQAITETESTFTKGEVLKNALTLSGGAVPSNDIVDAFTKLQKSGEIVKLDKNNFSTKEMIKTEKQIMSMMAAGKGQVEALMTPQEAEKAIADYQDRTGMNLTSGQKEYAQKLLTSNDRYLVVQGDAGVGKTAALELVNNVLSSYSDKQTELVGLGYTGKAAAELEKGSGGIKSQTIDSFLIGVGKDGKELSDTPATPGTGTETKGEPKGTLYIDERQFHGKTYERTFTNDSPSTFRKPGEKIEMLNPHGNGGTISYQRGTGNLSIGTKSSRDTVWGGGKVYERSEKILFGEDKGTKIRSKTEDYGMSRYTKTEKTDADGNKHVIKSSSFGEGGKGITLFAAKNQTEKITGKDGTTEKSSRTFTVMGFKFGKTMTKKPDGTVVETKWRGYETTNWMGQPEVKITHSESRVVKEPKTNSKASLGLDKNGNVVLSKGPFRVVLSQNGEGVSKELEPTKISGKEKIFIVDEASLVGSRQAHQLFKAAEREGGRVILVGDTKQLLGVAAGRMFSDSQKYGVVDVTRMNEVLRQKTDDYKAVVSDITGKRLDKAFGRLEKGGNLHQIADRDERINALVKDYTSEKNWKDTIVVTTRNADRQEINQSIRDELKSQEKIGAKDHSLNVRTPKSINTVNRHFAQSYREGDYVFSSKSGEGMRAGDEAKIININPKDHTLTLEKKTGEVVEFDLKKGGSSLSVYESQEKNFSTGEKIVFLKNSQKLGVQNGMTGEVQNINELGKMNVKLENGNEVSFNVKNYGCFDHGYVITDYKSQGQTSEKIIFHADTNEGGNNFNSFYVAATRGKEEMKVYTDDADRLKTQVSEEQTKKSTLDYQEKNGIDSDRELNKTDDKSISEVKEGKSETDKIKSDLSEKFESSLKDTDRGEKGIERDKSSMKENTETGKGTKEMERSESASSSAKTQDVGMEM